MIPEPETTPQGVNVKFLCLLPLPCYPSVMRHSIPTKSLLPRMARLGIVEDVRIVEWLTLACAEKGLFPTRSSDVLDES